MINIVVERNSGKLVAKTESNSDNNLQNNNTENNKHVMRITSKKIFTALCV